MTFTSYIRRKRIVHLRKFLARHVWIAVASGNIHMKTSQEQKWYANQLYELFSSKIGHARINGTVRVLFRRILFFL